jgi:hypothetical protein
MRSEVRDASREIRDEGCKMRAVNPASRIPDQASKFQRGLQFAAHKRIFVYYQPQ